MKKLILALALVFSSTAVLTVAERSADAWPFSSKDESDSTKKPKGGHNNNARGSTKDKHQKGDERRGRDQGGEKKDDKMKHKKPSRR